MRYTMMIMAMVLMACSSVTEPVAESGSTGVDGTVTVQYLVCGTCDGVSMAFCSDMGDRDTIPAAVLPILMEFELNSGTEAFVRANKLSDGVITVLVIANGFVNATDTALEGDRTAEARVEVW